MATFPYLRIHFLNTKYAFSKHCSSHKVFRNLAPADELPDKFAFLFRIRSSYSRAQDGLWAAVKIVLNGTSTFVALVHWMDQTLVCEELLPLSSQLSPPHGSSFMSDLNLLCKLHHLILDKWFTLKTKDTCSGHCVFRLSGIVDDTT